jgi:hypothetical protein
MHVLSGVVIVAVQVCVFGFSQILTIALGLIRPAKIVASWWLSVSCFMTWSVGPHCIASALVGTKTKHRARTRLRCIR